MKTGRIIAIAILCSFSMSMLLAAGDDPAKMREDMMKKNATAITQLTKMSKGTLPFDSEAVKTALIAISEVGKAFPDAYPVGSETASKASKAKIWEKMDDFKSKSAKLAADADAALKAPPADAAALGELVTTISKTCSACHGDYRRS